MKVKDMNQIRMFVLDDLWGHVWYFSECVFTTEGLLDFCSVVLRVFQEDLLDTFMQGRVFMSFYVSQQETSRNIPRVVTIQGFLCARGTRGNKTQSSIFWRQWWVSEWSLKIEPRDGRTPRTEELHLRSTYKQKNKFHFQIFHWKSCSLLHNPTMPVKKKPS